MSRKINLFGGPLLKMSKRTRRARLTRSFSIIGSIVVFVLIIGLSLYRVKLLGDIASVKQDQEMISAAIDRETPRQKDLQTILARLDVLYAALDNDVHYASRSAQVREMLGGVPSSPTLSRYSMDDQESFAMRIQFATQSDMLDFIQLSEEPSWGKVLKEHSIGTFRITTASDSGRLAELDFTGTFL